MTPRGIDRLGLLTACARKPAALWSRCRWGPLSRFGGHVYSYACNGYAAAKLYAASMAGTTPRLLRRTGEGRQDGQVSSGQRDFSDGW